MECFEKKKVAWKSLFIYYSILQQDQTPTDKICGGGNELKDVCRGDLV